MAAALEGGEWSAARPGRTLPPGKTQWALGPVWTGGKSRPNGNRSRTVQPVAQSLYRLSYRAQCVTFELLKLVILKIRLFRGVNLRLWVFLDV